MDCVVATAPRNDGWNIVFEFQPARGYASAFPRRDAPEVCVSFTLFQNRGRRESRAPIAPAVVRTTNARVDHRFNRIIPAFPARMVYGLLRALSGERAFLPPSPCELTMHSGPGRADTSPQDLTPASRRQDHTTSPSAPASPKLSPDLVRSGKFRRRRLAAPFVRTPADRSREDPPCNPLRARRCRVHRIPPRVRDVRETPLAG